MKILQLGPIPKHVGFIMDGNRRYARKQEKETWEGHEEGFKGLERTLEWSLELGITVVTVYAFSIDNFSRTEHEINTLFALAERKFRDFLAHDSFVARKGIRIRLIGDLSLLPPSTLAIAKELMHRTRHGANAILNIACPYTSTEEMSTCAKLVTERSKTGAGSIDIHDMEACLYTSEIFPDMEPHPPLDLLIRTSGERRLSNFLLWQVSGNSKDNLGAQIGFIDVLWPEFGYWNMLPILLSWQCEYLLQQQDKSNTNQKK